MMSTLEYRILGPLEIRSNHRPVRLPSPREQRLLAVLLLARNRPVPTSELVDQIWGSDPPPTARRQVHNGLSRLRRQLHTAGAPTDVVTNHGAGYQLRPDAAQLDAHRFQQLTAQAVGLPSRDHAARARHLRAALALWRGPALPGLYGSAIEAATIHLDEQRLSAYEQCIDAELELGEHQRLISEISELLAAHPLRERLVDQLMRALHRSGRRAEALQVHHRLAQRLADELGIDPGAELRRRYVAILRDEG
jgi:DNA-binding SARP family transcriptional activator